MLITRLPIRRLDDKRQANVKAASEAVSCLTVDRATFKRVLGPLEEILKGTKYVDKA